MKNKFTLLLFLSVSFIQAQTPISWTPKGVGGGSAINSPVISPFNPNNAIVSSDLGGAFFTNDFGQTWQIMNFRNLKGSSNGQVGFTNDPNVLYSTGDNSGPGGYVPKKSTDGGVTWVPFYSNPCNDRVLQLYTDLHNHRNIVISDRNQIFFSNQSDSSFITVVTNSLTKGVHLAGVFFDGDTIYVCSDENIYRSINGGNTFADTISHAFLNIPVTESVVSFTGAKQGNVIKFFCTTISESRFSFRTRPSNVTYFEGLYQMYNDSLPSWENITPALDAVALGKEKAYYVRTLSTDTNTVYIGGNLTDSTVTYGTVYKSTNGGSTWSNIFMDSTVASANTNITTGWTGECGSSSYNHSWREIITTEGICIDPNDVNRIIRTDKLNIYSSVDGGNHWNQMYVAPSDSNASNSSFPCNKYYATSGLETSVTNWLTWIDSLNMIASCNDIAAIKSNDGGDKWSFDYDHSNLFSSSLKINDVNMMVKHPVTNTIYAATGEIAGNNNRWDDFRLKQTKGRISFSTDNGATWQIMHDFNRPVAYLEIDKNNPEVMYASVHDTAGGSIGGIYRCDSVSLGVSANWIKLNVPARASNRPNNIYVMNDSSIMVSYLPFDSSGIGTYATQSGMFYSTDGGNTWTDRSDVNMQTHTFQVVVDPNDNTQQTWIACVGGTSPGVYRSTDRGISWIRTIPDKIVVSCTFNPVASNEMYICTLGNGLFYALTTNSNSPVVYELFDYPFRAPQHVFFNPYNNDEVWITSNGYGLSVGVNTGIILEAADNVYNDDDFSLFPNPANDLLYIKNPGKSSFNIQLFDITGKQLKEIKNQQDNGELMLNELSNGMYFVVITSEKKSYSHKIIVQH